MRNERNYTVYCQRDGDRQHRRVGRYTTLTAAEGVANRENHRTARVVSVVHDGIQLVRYQHGNKHEFYDYSPHIHRDNNTRWEQFLADTELVCERHAKVNCSQCGPLHYVHRPEPQDFDTYCEPAHVTYGGIQSASDC